MQRLIIVFAELLVGSVIRTVIFDLGGVIVRFTNDPYYQHLAEVSGKKHEFVKRTIESRELPLLESGRIGIKEFDSIVAKRLGIDRKKMSWFSFYKKTVKLDYDMMALVDILHKDYTTAFLSNIDKSRYQYTAKILDMELFDYRFASCYMGERKPGVHIYRHAVEQMHIMPDEAVFIDDRLENVVGARKAGLNVVHFKNRRFLDVKLAKMGL